MREYIGAATVAAWFGVERSTVAKWRERYPDTPAPDAMIDGTPGWLPSRETAWRRWEAARPGRGAGGGRPPRQPVDGAGSPRPRP